MRTRLEDDCTLPTIKCFDAQLPGDLVQRLIMISKPHHRCAGNHPQRADMRKVGDQQVGHTIGKGFLLDTARQVPQWQHEPGDARGSGTKPTITPPDGQPCPNPKQNRNQNNAAARAAIARLFGMCHGKH